MAGAVAVGLKKPEVVERAIPPMKPYNVKRAVAIKEPKLCKRAN